MTFPVPEGVSVSLLNAFSQVHTRYIICISHNFYLIVIQVVATVMTLIASAMIKTKAVYVFFFLGGCLGLAVLLQSNLYTDTLICTCIVGHLCSLRNYGEVICVLCCSVIFSDLLFYYTFHTYILFIVFINPKLRRAELDSSSATKFNIDCSKIFRSNKNLTIQAEAQD